MRPYKLISHTADIGIKVKGKTLKGLFKNSAFALFDIISDLNRIKVKEDFKLNLKSENLEELLHDWLKELLFQCNVNLFVFKEFHIARLNNTSIESTAIGEHITSKDILKTEVKAVTYHNLAVKKEKDIWKAEIIFDV